MVQADGYLMEFTTDSPCHLWMRYKSTRPGKRLQPILRRGIQMHCTPIFAFYGAKKLEQQEAGDTLIHSFMLRPYLAPDHYFFYLYGQVAGVDSPSTSPVMHLPFDHANRNLTGHQSGSSESGMAVSYNRPRAMQFHCTWYGGIDGVQVYCYTFNNPQQIRVAIYSATPIIKYPDKELTSVLIHPMPTKRTWPNKGILYFPLPHLALRFGFTYHIVIIGDLSQPANDVFWWSRWPLPADDPGMSSFYGERINHDWNWHIHTVSVLHYSSWKNLPYYRPGPPTLEQIPA